MINAKYRVRDVAKDLDVKTNYVTELIEKNFGGAKKSSMTALESDELDLLFDTVTKENAVDSFDEYFALTQRSNSATHGLHTDHQDGKTKHDVAHIFIGCLFDKHLEDDTNDSNNG